jgi:hypothetical protein
MRLPGGICVVHIVEPRAYADLYVIRLFASGWRREAPGAVDSRMHGNDDRGGGGDGRSHAGSRAGVYSAAMDERTRIRLTKYSTKAG